MSSLQEIMVIMKEDDQALLPSSKKAAKGRGSLCSTLMKTYFYTFVLLHNTLSLM